MVCGSSGNSIAESAAIDWRGRRLASRTVAASIRVQSSVCHSSSSRSMMPLRHIFLLVPVLLWGCGSAAAAASTATSTQTPVPAECNGDRQPDTPPSHPARRLRSPQRRPGWHKGPATCRCRSSCIITSRSHRSAVATTSLPTDSSLNSSCCMIGATRPSRPRSSCRQSLKAPCFRRTHSS